MRRFLHEFGADLLALLLVVASLLALFLVASLAAGQSPAAAAPYPLGRVHASAVGNKRVGKVFIEATVTKAEAGFWYEYRFRYFGKGREVQCHVRALDQPARLHGVREGGEDLEKGVGSVVFFDPHPPARVGGHVYLTVTNPDGTRGGVRAWQKLPVPDRAYDLDK